MAAPLVVGRALAALQAGLKGLGGSAAGAAGGAAALDAAMKALGSTTDVVIDAVKDVNAQVQKSIKEFSELEAAMDRVQAVSGAAAWQIEALGDQVRALSGESGFKSADTVKALQELADAGMNSKEQMQSLGPAVDLAKGASLEAGKAAGALVSTMKDFALGAGEAGRAADVMAAGIAAGRVPGQDLVAAFDAVGSKARTMGQSLEGTGAALSLLYRSTGDGAEAGKALSGLFDALSEKGAKLGVSVTDSSGQMLPLVDILKKLEEAGVTGEEALDKLGKAGGPALQALLETGSEALKGLEDQMQSSGQAAEGAAERSGTLQSDLAELASTAQGVYQALGEAIAPILQPIIQGLTTMVEWIRESIESFNQMVASSDALALIRDVLGWVWEMLTKVWERVKELIPEWVNFNNVLMVLAPGLAGLKRSFEELERISGILRESWNALMAAAYTTFGAIVGYIATAIDKVLAGVELLLVKVHELANSPVISVLPGGDKIAELAAPLGGFIEKVRQAREDVQNFGTDWQEAARIAAEERLETYSEPSTQLPRDESVFAPSLADPSPKAEAAKNQVNAAAEEMKQRLAEVEVAVRKVDQAFAALESSVSLEHAIQAHQDLSVKIGEVNVEIAKHQSELSEAEGDTTSHANALESLAQTLVEVNERQAEANRLLQAAAIDPVLEKLKELQEAYDALADSSILNVQERFDSFAAKAEELNELIEEQKAILEKHGGGSEAAAEALSKLEDHLSAVQTLQAAANDELGKHSDEAKAAAAALKELANASPEEAEAKVNQLKDALLALQSAAAKARSELDGTQAGPGYQAASDELKQMDEDFQVLNEGAKEFNSHIEEGTEESTEAANVHFEKFVDGVTGKFQSAFADMLKGEFEGWESFFDSIADMFADLVAQMVADWAKAQFTQQGLNASGQGSGSLAGIGNSFGQGASGFASAVFLGIGVGSYTSSALGGDSDTGAVLGTAGAIAGWIIGAKIGAEAGAKIYGFYGALIGAVIGGIVAALISYKPSPRGYAEIGVRDGFAVVDVYRKRSNADMKMLREYATGVTDAINEIVLLTEGTLTSLPSFTLETKKNKYYRVIDASGFVHKFDKDLEAATDYAVTQALKGAKFDGLSPEVQAALDNSMASTAEGLKSDVEFAVMVRDLDLHPVTKDLRDLIKAFNIMRERARALGISLDKVDDAFNRSIEEMKDNILSGLESFADMGLTDVEREAKRITQAFAEMRENARAFNEELAGEKKAREDQIVALQDQLAEQERLKELYEQMAAQNIEFPEPDYPEGFGPKPGFQRPDFDQLAEEAGAAVAALMEEIARLIDLNTQQTLIDMEEIRRAEQAARAALRERVRDSLKPYLYQDLAPVVAQVEQLNDAFEKLRRDAAAAGVPQHEVNQAYNAGLRNIEEQFRDQLQPFQDMADGVTPLEVELRELEKQFDDLRAGAEALGIPLEEIAELEQAAKENLQDKLRDQLQGYVDQGANPMVVTLRDLAETFEELRQSAEALGIASEEVDAAWQAALETQQRQLQEGVQAYLDYGNGLSELAVRHRDLGKFFEEQMEAARALDEAMGFADGEGPNQAMIAEAEAAAFQQLTDDFIASMQDLRDAGLSPTEIALRDLNERFTEMRSDAELLGLSIEEVSRLEREAVDRMWADLQRSLDDYLLTDEEKSERDLNEEFMGYLSDALTLGTYELGSTGEEMFPGARELESEFDLLRASTQELAAAFHQAYLVATGAADPSTLAAGPGPNAGDPAAFPVAPGEMLARVMDQLPSLRASGETYEHLDTEAAEGIDSAATKLTQEILKLQLGLSDNTDGIDDALGSLIEQMTAAGLEVDTSLVQLAETLESGDMEEFLAQLGESLLDGGASIGELLNLLLEDMSMPELMQQFADGTFDAIAALLGLTEIPEELAAMLQQMGEAYQVAEQERRQRFQAPPRSSSSQAGDRQSERDSLIEQLERYEDLALSPTARELKKLNEEFDEIRESARRLGVPLERVEGAYQIALDNLRQGLRDQLKPFNQLGLSPVAAELARLDEQFAELRESAQLLGIPLSEVEEAYENAVEQQRKGVIEQIESYEDLGLNPVAAELKNLDKVFAELRESAELLGIPMERVEAAYENAVEQQRKAVREQLEAYHDLGLSPIQQELKNLDKVFEELRESAELLGIPMSEVDAAYEAAIEQQRDALYEQLRPFEEIDMSAGERELLRLEEQFEQIREDAIALGADLERVEEAYAAAIEDFWERTLQPIKDFQDSLDLSDLSTLTPEERLAEAQADFDDLAARALAGDFDAIAQLPQAAQALLQEARGFYASGQGYEDIFGSVNSILDQILELSPVPPEEEPATTSDPMQLLSTLFAGGLPEIFGGGMGLEELLAAAGLPVPGLPTEELLGGIYRPAVFADGSEMAAYLPFLSDEASPFRPYVDSTDLARPIPVEVKRKDDEERVLVEEMRKVRLQASEDQRRLREKVEEQGIELRELRTLMRRVSSRTEFGGRASK